MWEGEGAAGVFSHPPTDCLVPDAPQDGIFCGDLEASACSPSQRTAAHQHARALYYELPPPPSIFAERRRASRPGCGLEADGGLLQ